MFLKIKYGIDLKTTCVRHLGLAPTDSHPQLRGDHLLIAVGRPSPFAVGRPSPITRKKKIEHFFFN